jgi:hypothetical protein
MNAWDRQPGETAKTYSYLALYLRLGPTRSLPQLVDTLGGKPSVKTIREHSAAYNWALRASQYDNSLLAEHREAVTVARGEVREYLKGLAGEAIDTLVAIMRDPDEAGKTRVAACKDILDRGGIVAPKRTEISGPDGGPIPFEVRSMVAHLSLDEIRRMRADIQDPPRPILEGAGDSTLPR